MGWICLFLLVQSHRLQTKVLYQQDLGRVIYHCGLHISRLATFGSLWDLKSFLAFSISVSIIQRIPIISFEINVLYINDSEKSHFPNPLMRLTLTDCVER